MSGKYLRADDVPVAQGPAKTKVENLGTDDNAPFRVFHDVLRPPLATPLEYPRWRQGCRGRGGR